VRVLREILSPCVQNAEGTGLGAEIAPVAANGGKHVHAGVEQQIVEQSLIVKDQRIEFDRNGEDHMEVCDGQQLPLPLLEPAGARQRTAFGTVTVAAGVIADKVFAAMAALIDMAAECGRPADLNGAHGPQNGKRQSMGLPVGLAVLSKDIGHFQRGARHLLAWNWR